MKFLRHLAAVVIVVAVIVGLGLLWAHASGTGAGAIRGPSRAVIQRMEQVRTGAVAIRTDDGFQLGNSRNLIQTCVIETVLAAAVIVASALWRQHRRMRRTSGARRLSGRGMVEEDGDEEAGS